MSHWFDTAAVEVATGRGVTRREGLRRAALAVLVSGPLATIAGVKWPRVASAQGPDPCAQCHREARSSTAGTFRACAKAFLATVWTPFGGLFTLGCHFGNIASYASDTLDCEADICGRPPPQQGTGCQAGPAAPRGARGADATCTLVPPTPPPTVPPITAECDNCKSAGGKCCGFTLDGHLCACANPSLDCCGVYGCCG